MCCPIWAVVEQQLKLQGSNPVCVAAVSELNDLSSDRWGSQKVGHPKRAGVHLTSEMQHAFCVTQPESSASCPLEIKQSFINQGHELK